MCARFRLARRKKILEQELAAIFDLDPPEIIARYNIAPTQPILAVRQKPDRPIRTFSTPRWGLIPSWFKDKNRAKDAGGSVRNINARSETAATSPSFREPFISQRCLIPADGFYEWQQRNKLKQPYCFEVGHGELFAFAGLWDCWPNPAGETIHSCTILTTTPNSLIAEIHDRMPVILHPNDFDLWLDPHFKDVATLSAMLKPYDPTRMRRYPVSPKINDAKNDDIGSAQPIVLSEPSQ